MKTSAWSIPLVVLFLGFALVNVRADSQDDEQKRERERDHDRPIFGGGVTIDLNDLFGKKKKKEPEDPSDIPTGHGNPYHTQERVPPPVLGILLERDRYWIPEDKGHTWLDATIYAKSQDGKKWVRSDIATTIAFHFVERSNEPGDCLNHGTGTDPDLWFPPAENPELKCITRDENAANGDYPDWASTKNPVTHATAYVACGDYGAFSKVEAEGDECVHLMKINGEITQVDRADAILTVPRDNNDNQIADTWETIVDMHPRPSADKDNQPEGNGIDGDGLSAYEEYRGFMVSGTHQRTPWDRKDLFVYNQDHIPTNRFEFASGLNVWWISASEMSSDRVINFNWHHASLHEQHALTLKYESLADGVAGQCIPRLGPPKYVDRVAVDPAHCFNSSQEGSVADHELGHAVSMQHHGNRAWSGGSFFKETMIYPDTWGNYLMWRTVAPGTTLCGCPLPHYFVIETERHTQLSGDDTCIMRYPYAANTIFHIGGNWECVETDPHKTLIFCTSPTGTGLNANGHAAADAAVGNCMGQIDINDL